MDKVAEFYARWFAKKPAPAYSVAEAAAEELANDLLVRQFRFWMIPSWLWHRAPGGSRSCQQRRREKAGAMGR